MEDVKITGRNVIAYGQPVDWDEAKHGPCRTLLVHKIKSDGLDFVSSFWQPSQEELAMLNAGAAVCVSLVTPVQPPIMVMVMELPNAEVEEVSS